MNKWVDILKPVDKNKKFWAKCVFISAVILVAAVGINTWNTQDSSKVINELKYICDIVIALTTTVLATFLLNIIYNLAESRKINAIATVSYEGLLPDLLKSLEKFKGRYRKNESVLVELHKYDDVGKKDFYKVVFEYQYATNLKNLKELQFKFYRIYDGNINDFSGGLNEQYLTCDFIWGVDESGFQPNIINDADYTISQLIIGNNQISDLTQYRKLSTFDAKSIKNRIVSYNIPLSKLQNINKNELVQLSYRVTLPLEKEDVLLITHELPTEKAKIVFDYTEVREEISVYGIPVTGTIEPLEPEKDNDSKIKYVISGWILPKQGYVFGWWKK